MTVIKVLPHPPGPLGGVKYSSFAITVSYQYFLLKFRMHTEVQKYETYQTQFPIQGLCLTPWLDLGVGVKSSKLNLFRTMSCCISN